MDVNSQIDLKNTPSQLENFKLGFEYDKTLNEIRYEVRNRSIK